LGFVLLITFPDEPLGREESISSLGPELLSHGIPRSLASLRDRNGDISVSNLDLKEDPAAAALSRELEIGLELSAPRGGPLDRGALNRLHCNPEGFSDDSIGYFGFKLLECDI
jgi:hypothetical protein